MSYPTWRLERTPDCAKQLHRGFVRELYHQFRRLLISLTRLEGCLALRQKNHCSLTPTRHFRIYRRLHAPRRAVLQATERRRRTFLSAPRRTADLRMELFSVERLPRSSQSCHRKAGGARLFLRDCRGGGRRRSALAVERNFSRGALPPARPPGARARADRRERRHARRVVQMAARFHVGEPDRRRHRLGIEELVGGHRPVQAGGRFSAWALKNSAWSAERIR